VIAAKEILLQVSGGIMSMSTTAELRQPRTARALIQLDQLKQCTKVVALREFAPQDATTNPPLILKATQLPSS
jgi:hypothetical protein